MGLIASRANPHLRAPSLAKEAPLLLTLTSRLMRCRDSAHRAAPVWRVGSLHRAGNLQRSMATRVMAPMKTTAAPIPIVVPPPAESHMLSPLLRLLRVPPLLRLSRVLLVRVLDSRVLLSKRTTRTRLIRLPLRWSAPCKLQLQCHSRATPQAQRPRVPWGATRFELTRGGGGAPEMLEMKLMPLGQQPLRPNRPVDSGIERREKRDGLRRGLLRGEGNVSQRLGLRASTQTRDARPLARRLVGCLWPSQLRLSQLRLSRLRLSQLRLNQQRLSRQCLSRQCLSRLLPIVVDLLKSRSPRPPQHKSARGRRRMAAVLPCCTP